MLKTTTAALTLLLGVAFLSPPEAEAKNRPLTPGEIYKTYGKGVVLVFGTDGSAQGSAGTGSIISADGQVITNAHVVAKNGRTFKRVFVYLKPDKLQGSMKDDLTQRYKAVVVDINKDLDLALLKIVKAPDNLTVINMVNPNDVEIGDPVVAIGHPETGGLWTLTTGSVSSVIKDFQGVKGKHVFQTEASVNRGNSGGPLLSAYGHLVGINTSISRKAADGLAITDINFSLKSSVARDWLERRKLLALSYVPRDHIPGGAIAMAEPPKATDKAPPKDTPKVDAGDGKTMVLVLEPEGDDVVANDPEYWANASGTQNVSRKMGGRRVRHPSQQRLRPKQLTKARPYKLDRFVSARVKEMRSMEKMIDEFEGEIDKRSGKKKKRPGKDGMGLW